MTNIKEKLELAKKELLEYEEKSKNLKELEEKTKQLEKQLSQFEATKKKAIDDTMKEKKKELDSQYNQIIVDLTKKIEEAKDKKKQEIKKNKEERISNETKENKESIGLLKNQIKELLKENKISAIAGTEFYITFFKITTVKRFIKAFISYVLLIVGLPLIISYILLRQNMFSNTRNILIVAAVFILNILLWGLLWLLISKITNMPEEIYLKLKNLNMNIEDNKSQIKIKTRNIMNDNDESKYNYTQLDRDIEEANLNIKQAKEQNEKDINILNTVIHDDVVREIETESKNEYDNIKSEYDHKKVEYEMLKEEVEKNEQEIEKQYIELVGKENLTSNQVEKLISVLDEHNEDDLLLQRAKEIIKKK